MHHWETKFKGTKKEQGKRIEKKQGRIHGYPSRVRVGGSSAGESH